MKKLDRQRKLTLAALSMALVVAVYLNWQYSRVEDDSYISAQDAATLNGQFEQTAQQIQLTNPEGDMLAVTSDEEIENYGDAQLVATSGKSAQKYFEETRLTREKSRDEALDVLQKTLKNAKISDAEKVNATEKLSRIVQDITTETDVENLVKAKGFTECVAFINGEKITVAVRTSGGDITPQQVAQVRDIVLGKTTVEAQNIVVIEVK
ncbi:MAG: SpoIIIAH-like family protein [Oscillospiraceae bacterium]|nr:SpoIIIAH-like family protein [Oscillospiraceae bacterium]